MRRSRSGSEVQVLLVAGARRRGEARTRERGDRLMGRMVVVMGNRVQAGPDVDLRSWRLG